MDALSGVSRIITLARTLFRAGKAPRLAKPWLLPASLFGFLRAPRHLPLWPFRPTQMLPPTVCLMWYHWPGRYLASSDSLMRQALVTTRATRMDAKEGARVEPSRGESKP